ncbi:MAG: sulfotransferase [Alphaproteobacteria bacterium]|nr:sulfotransferase [Alphaproteobacteria bacterium]MBV9863134.1 sulfotransferase [Alphaproteobacteria bacterium]
MPAAIDAPARLADFICVGAQKAGTSWLYRQLLGHPSIYMRTKETNFFMQQRPAAQYAAFFAEARADQLTGDISPNYMGRTEIAGRIHALCPQARLIMLLRDPVARAHSQWKMSRALGNMPLETTLLEAFADDLNRLRTRGEYAAILKGYLRLFELGKQLAVFWYDDIRDRPERLIRRVACHIGLKSAISWPYLQEVVYPSPRSDSLDAAAAKVLQAYYAPHDAELRAVLNVPLLPWERRATSL